MSKCIDCFVVLQTSFQVTDMATVLNTIDVFEKIKVSPAQLATTHLATYVRRLRRNTTNKYLANRLRDLLKKWDNPVAVDKTKRSIRRK